MDMKSVKLEDGMLWIAGEAENSLSYLGIFTTKKAANKYAAELNAANEYGEIEVTGIFPNAVFALLPHRTKGQNDFLVLK